MIALSKPVSLVTMVMFCKTSLAARPPRRASPKASPDFSILATMMGQPQRDEVNNYYENPPQWKCDCDYLNRIDEWKCQNPEGCDTFRVHTAAFKEGLERELKVLKSDEVSDALFKDGLQAIRDHLQAQNPGQFLTADEQPHQTPPDEVEEMANDRDEKEQPEPTGDGNVPPEVDGAPVQETESDDASDASRSESGEASRCEAAKKIFGKLRDCGYCCISALGTYCLVSQISEWCSQEDCCSACFEATLRTLLCCGHGSDIVEQVVLFCNCMRDVLRSCCECFGECLKDCTKCDCDCDGDCGDCNIDCIVM